MPHEKIKRDAFLYLEPKKLVKDHAQCSACMMWTGPKKKLCSIHGEGVEVLGSMSCGFYVEGKPMPEMMVHKSVTPQESGLVDRKVRCENCEHADLGRKVCHMYEELNEDTDELFDLDVNIEPKGCCNAQTPRLRTIENLRRMAER